MSRIKYKSISELVELAQKEHKTIGALCLEDQAAELGLGTKETFARMEERYEVMCRSADWGRESGRRSTSGLTGGEGEAFLAYAAGAGGEGALLGALAGMAVGNALAISNCNAAMGRIVAAPTAGSCGILPGCLIALGEKRGIAKEKLILSLFTAGAFGMVVADRASIAGAQGGCQAECGCGAGMAAAAVVECMGGTPAQCAAALGIALVNQMGLVCDPVAGLVEIPCIKRNAGGVAIALSAADMALAGLDLKIPADECIDAMKQVGDLMSSRLKETSGGGLAVTPTGKKLREQVFGSR